MDGHVYTIPAVIRTLREVTPPGGRVLSAYVDTAPARIAGQAYLLAFRDNCKTIRPELDAAERERFQSAVTQAERYLAEAFVPTGRGLALFASGQPDYFYVTSLPTRPIEDVAWGEQPLLNPLEEILDECERVAVVLFDKERARLFTIYLGAIEDRRVIEDEVPGKQATGGWFALAQARYARHHEYHVLQHAKRVIATLMAELRARPFDRLLLGGPDEALAVLEQRLPRPLHARLAGTLHLELFASEAEVLRAALRTAEEIERREEVAAVQELVEAATTPRAALGLRPTLAALNDGRVHRLFVASGFAGIGGECGDCRRLDAGVGRCPFCGGNTRQVGDLRERLLGRAAEQGARIEFVSGEAASLLAMHDSLGAWTRY